MEAQLADLPAILETLRSSTDPRLVPLPDVAPAPPRLGLLSGSFDPPTIGHSALAEAALHQWADLVLFVYSVRAIPKEGPAPPPLLTEDERLAAVTAFCRDRRAGGLLMSLGLCSHGLLAEQVRAARARFASAELSLVMGSDKLLQILDPKWYEDPQTALSGLFAEARVDYAVRTGEDRLVKEVLRRPENARWASRLRRLAVPEDVAAISSRRVRELIRRGDDVRHLVPEETYRFLPRPGWADRTYNP